MQYRVVIGGENFFIHVDGQKRKVFFSTGLLVEAEDEHTASELALRQIAQEMSNMVLNDRSDPPQMLIHELAPHEGELPPNFDAFEWSEEKKKDDVWVPKISDEKK